MRAALRFLGLLLLSVLALQLAFALRIALMAVLDPQSTTFQRSEIRRLLAETHALRWSQAWRPYGAIADPLKRAVIASEDACFAEHGGIDWEAIVKAWDRNQRAEARAARLQSQWAAHAEATSVARARPVRLVGGSTITQQLAKNLFLSGERSLARKGQELVLAYLLEATLDKQRILEIYLNSVEWGEGVFGAEAAAQHYFNTPAARLSAGEAARLAVMLPSPKFFERRPGSAYLSGRASTIVARMPAVELP
jgi:monofunctional biosynthetic peptidoglycan transglycosylase